jgi:DNA-binding transcriptional MerR regulator
MEYTVGELAKLSGLTVRTLHHYEQQGLLHPSGRTEAGYRQYTERDVVVLHRILAYRQMGLALKDIAPLLGPDAPPLSALLGKQIELAEVQLARQQRLIAMLKRVQARVDEGGEGLADHLLKLMSMSRLYERWMSEEDLAKMQAMQAGLDPQMIRHLRDEVAALVPAMQAALARGADPREPEVAALARRWLALETMFPVDDALRDKGRAMFAGEPGLQRETGITPALIQFIDAAVNAVREAA